jgi:DNA-binding beta-propeller fold protein YncE
MTLNAIGNALRWRRINVLLLSFVLALRLATCVRADEPQRLLYVAAPGVRNLLEFGGHGVLVFDIDNGHRFVRRIPTGGLGDDGQPLNVKGICACAATGRLYVSTLKHVLCLDLNTDKLLWERTYDGGCDRLAINPEGSRMYVPSLEGPHWHFLDAATGDVLAKVVPDSGAHNTICGSSGNFVYLAGLKSPLLSVADAHGSEVLRTVGPFSQSIRPFTVNHDETLCFVNLNELLGFEVGDLRTGKKLHRVEVQGFQQGPVKRHGCPSHGIGLSPDEREIWVTDAHNQRLHVFDATVMPPKQLQSIPLRDEPGWVTFSIDGQYAYPSTGEVIDAATKQIVVQLSDEERRAVQSEKMLEIDFESGRAVRNGDQFGVGRKQP